MIVVADPEGDAVRSYDASTYENKLNLCGFQASGLCGAVQKVDGGRFAVGHLRSISVRDALTGTKLRELRVQDAGASPPTDGAAEPGLVMSLRTVASGGLSSARMIVCEARPNNVVVLDVETGEQLGKLSDPQPTFGIHHVPEWNDEVFSCSKAALHCNDLTSGRLVKKVSTGMHSGTVTGLTSSLSRSLLFSVSHDRTAKMWSHPSLACAGCQKLSNAGGCCLCADDRDLLAIGLLECGSVEIWDLRNTKGYVVKFQVSSGLEPIPAIVDMARVEDDLFVTACDVVSCWRSDGKIVKTLDDGFEGCHGVCSIGTPYDRTRDGVPPAGAVVDASELPSAHFPGGSVLPPPSDALLAFLRKHEMEELHEALVAQSVKYGDLRSFLEEGGKAVLAAILPRKQFLQFKLLRAIQGMPATSEESAAPAAVADAPVATRPAWLLHPASVQVQLSQEIGRGSFGVVYRGDLHLGLVFRGPVAVKRISLSHVGRAQIEKEVSLLAELEDRFVLRAFGCWFDPDYAWIVTELCSKGHLSQFLEAEKPSVDARVKLLGDIASGMAYLHSCGVVHRDLKPLNVLVNEDNVVKICDYGVSKHEGSETSAGGLKGTARFIAPVRPPRTARECDVYAFGALAYEVLSDKHMFPDLLARYEGEQLVSAIRERGVYPDVRQELATLRREIQDLVASCWSASPEDWKTFSELEKGFHGR